MSEFGHFGTALGNGFIDTWGAGPFILGRYRFEDSDRFGPALVNRNGELKADPYPGENSPFWMPYNQWVKQGRRLQADGVTCIWDDPKPTYFRRIGKRREIVTHGEEGGRFIEITEDTRNDRSN